MPRKHIGILARSWRGGARLLAVAILAAGASDLPSAHAGRAECGDINSYYVDIHALDVSCGTARSVTRSYIRRFTRCGNVRRLCEARSAGGRTFRCRGKSSPRTFGTGEPTFRVRCRQEGSRDKYVYWWIIPGD